MATAFLMVLFMTAASSNAWQQDVKLVELQEMLPSGCEDLNSCVYPPSSWNSNDTSLQDTAKIYAREQLRAAQHYKDVPASEWGFARLSNLTAGSDLHVPVLDDKLPRRSFIPKKVIDRLPADPAQTISLFGFEPTSEFFAIMLESYHAYCQARLLPGEFRQCLSSSDNVISFFDSQFPDNTPRAVQLPFWPSEAIDITIDKVTELPQMLSVCHSVVYPYALLSCHYVPDTKAFYVEGRVHGSRSTSPPLISVVLICHLNTTGFHSYAPGLVALGKKPGESEVCHFYAQNDLLAVA